MQKVSFLLVILVAAAVAGRAQGVRTGKAPLCGTVVLGDVPDKYNATVYSKEMPEPDAQVEQKKLQQIKEQAAKLYPRKMREAQKKRPPQCSQRCPLVSWLIPTPVSRPTITRLWVRTTRA